METSTVEAAGQAATSSNKAKKGATEIFGDMLARLLDRIGATPDGQDDLDEAFFQTNPREAQRSATTDRPDEPPQADARKPRDDRRDDPSPIAAAVLDALRDVQRDRNQAGSAETEPSDDKFHPDATAAPRSPSPTAEPGAAARVPTTNQAKEAPPVPVPATPFAASGNAGNAPPPQVQVTVAPAAVQAQPTAPLAAGSTLALQEQGADAPKPAPSAGAGSTPATPAVAGASDGGANRDAGANGNSGQPGSGQPGSGQPGSGQPGLGNLPAGIVMPAAAIAQAAGSAATPASFAAALDDGAADGIGETAASPVLPANALSNAEATAGAKRAAATSPTPPLPRLAAMEQIAINIRKAVAAGSDEVTIQLRPDELGRIDVRMEVGKDGQVSAHIRADKPETLDLLQRDARGLERVLQDAGLRTDGNSLSFGLRGENGGNGRTSDRPQPNADPDGLEESTAPLPALPRVADGRVDLHV